MYRVILIKYKLSKFFYRLIYKGIVRVHNYLEIYEFKTWDKKTERCRTLRIFPQLYIRILIHHVPLSICGNWLVSMVLISFFTLRPMETLFCIKMSSLIISSKLLLEWLSKDFIYNSLFEFLYQSLSPATLSKGFLINLVLLLKTS